MKFKSLMLGAAAVATATTAQAADLPVAPEPVDYVRICDAYGARFYYIPGTETCLRVGGRVRTQFIANNMMDNGAWGDRDEDGYAWRTQGYLYLDARAATDFGTLRAYTELSGRAQNGAETFDFGSTYIQWGGLTAGYLGSNFDIFTGQVFMGVVGRDWSDATVNQIAYTASFGSGFSATFAIEDGSARQTGDYGGTRMPDVVGALGVSQGWGSAQLSGAVHHIYPDAANNNPTGGEDNFGWAVGAGAKINLPMLSSGSNIYFQGFYADGALAYLGGISGVELVDTNGDTVAAASDYAGEDTQSGYSLSAGAFYQATDTIGLALDGSYASIDLEVGSESVDVTRYAIDGSVQWEPVSGFVLGADMGYASTSGDLADVEDKDELLVGVRAQRTF